MSSAKKDELVAAEAGQDAVGPGEGRQAGGDLDQQQVAFPVPQAVVDQLEPVQIQEQHGTGRVRLPGESHLDPVHQKSAIEQPRQPVMVGIVEQTRFDPFALADLALEVTRVTLDIGQQHLLPILQGPEVVNVGRCAQPLDDRTRLVPDGRRTRAMPQVSPVCRTKDAELRIELTMRPRRLPGFDRRTAIIRVHGIEPAPFMALLLRLSGEATPLWAGPGPMAHVARTPHQLRDALDHDAKVALRVGGPLAHAVEIIDVDRTADPLGLRTPTGPASGAARLWCQR